MAGILSYALKLDTGAFSAPLDEATKGVDKHSAATEGLGHKTSELVGELKKFLIEMAVLATGIEGVKAAWEHFKGAIEKGHELETLSMRTGASVKDLAIMQQAFAATGAGADALGPTLNRMLVALGGVNEEGVATKGAFEQLGLDMDALGKMGTLEKFQAIGKAISEIGTAAGRAAAAKDVFGKMGGSVVLPMFLTPGALELAQKMTGLQAEILEEKAKAFSEAAVYLNAGGLKLQGFFVGAASELVDVMLPALRSFAAMDYSGLGKQAGSIAADLIKAVGEVFGFFDGQVDFSFGAMLQSGLAKAKEISSAMLEGVRFFREAFNQGRLGELLGLELRIGMVEAVNFFSAGLQNAWGWMSTEIPKAFRNSVAILTDPALKLFFSSLVTGLVEGLKSGFYAAGAILLEAIGRTKADLAEAGARFKIEHWGTQRERANPFWSYSPEQKERFKAQEIAVARSEAHRGTLDFESKSQEAAKKAQDAFSEAGANMKDLRESGASSILNDSVAALAKLGEIIAGGSTDEEALRKALDELKAEIKAGIKVNAPPETGGGHGEKHGDRTYVNNPDKESQKAAAAKKAEKEDNAVTDWGLENKLLDARAGGHRKQIEAAQRAIDFTKISRDLQDKQGLGWDAANKLAEERLQLEDRAAGKKRRGVLDEAATTAKRLARQDKRAENDALFNPQKAAEALQRGEADPGRRAREAAADRAWQAAEDQKKAAKELNNHVAGIHGIMQKVGVA